MSTSLQRPDARSVPGAGDRRYDAGGCEPGDVPLEHESLHRDSPCDVEPFPPTRHPCVQRAHGQQRT